MINKFQYNVVITLACYYIANKDNSLIARLSFSDKEAWKNY